MAMQQRKVKQRNADALSSNPRPTSVREGSRQYQNVVNSRLNVHFALLVILFLVAALVLWYFMLSLQQKKMYQHLENKQAADELMEEQEGAR